VRVRHPSTTLVSIAAAWILVLLSGGCSDRPDTVVIVGDSIAEEAVPYLEDQLGGVKLVPHVFGGTAPCDWTVEELDVHEGDLVVVSFTGNSFTPCMADGAGGHLGGDDLVAKYAADLGALVKGVRDRGGEVLLVAQPERGPSAPDSAELHGINDALTSLADQDGVSLVDAGAAVEADDGTFTAQLPCLEGEQECGPRGQNPVRNLDGVHLCPENPAGRQCPVYASGAFRFATAIADAIESR
jgi:hypothetical protein